MKRADMLHCAGVTAARYTVLKQRSQLPFLANEDDGELMGSKYTLDHAYQLRLTLDLIGGESSDDTQLQGLGPSYASSAVANSARFFPRHPLEQIEPLDWWAGVVVFEDEWPSRQEFFRWSAWFAGELQHFPNWVEQKSKREPAEDGSVTGFSRVVRTFLVNATRAADYVRERARQRGLPEGEFAHPYNMAAGQK